MIISKLRLFKEAHNVFCQQKSSLPNKPSTTGAARIGPAFRHCRLHGESEGKGCIGRFFSVNFSETAMSSFSEFKAALIYRSDSRNASYIDVNSLAGWVVYYHWGPPF